MTVRHRRTLVKQLESARSIRSASVRDAFLQVPREFFLPEVAERMGVAAVYRDDAYPTKTDPSGDPISSSSQPQIMAAMLEELHVEPGHRILEVGTGTGYNAALLDAIAGPNGRITSIELAPDVAKQARRSLRAAGARARVVVGDGRDGWETDAPFDRIIVTASVLDVPCAFSEQLRDDGRLVLPLRLTDSLPFRQAVVTFERVGRRLRSVSVIHGGFMRLRDRPGDPSLPWPSTSVLDRRGGSERTLASFSGSTWGRLTEGARRDLLASIMARPRSRPIEMRLTREQQFGLETFLCIAAPEDRLVGCTRHDLAELSFFGTAAPAIVHVDPVGLALLAGVRSISRIDAYGDDRAERLLADLVNEWRHLGRPDVTDLDVEISRGRSRPGAWMKRRGSSTISFDYRRATVLTHGGGGR